MLLRSTILLLFIGSSLAQIATLPSGQQVQFSLTQPNALYPGIAKVKLVSKSTTAGSLRPNAPALPTGKIFSTNELFTFLYLMIMGNGGSNWQSMGTLLAFQQCSMTVKGFGDGLLCLF